MPLPSFANLSGAGTSGGGGANIFGSRVAPIRTPTPYNDISAIYPNLGATNAAASGGLMSELKGQLSPGTLQSIQDAVAQFGVSSGMPGSGLSQNRSLRDVGLTSENLVHQGIGDYSNLIGAVSGTQTVKPETQAEIGATNAVNASSPDPAAAGSYAQGLFDKYLANLSKPTSGRSGAGANLPWYAQASNTAGAGWGPASAPTELHTIQGQL